VEKSTQLTLTTSPAINLTGSIIMADISVVQQTFRSLKIVQSQHISQRYHTSTFSIVMEDIQNRIRDGITAVEAGI
jgi:hypothetical protein